MRRQGLVLQAASQLQEIEQLKPSRRVLMRKMEAAMLCCSGHKVFEDFANSPMRGAEPVQFCKGRRISRIH